jgi:hypothetical protein
MMDLASDREMTCLVEVVAHKLNAKRIKTRSVIIIVISRSGFKNDLYSLFLIIFF